MPDRSATMDPASVEGFQAELAPPMLVAGDRMDQPTFHARYRAMPPGTRAELIDGVVHMPSPVGPDHASAHVPTILWLDHFAEQTTGLQVLDNATAILGPGNEPQPDAILRILPEFGGRSRVVDRMLVGAPELVAEIAHASRYVDLGPKRRDYERAGVLEYVVRALEPDAVFWFVLREGRFEERTPGPDGLYRSEAFPGLWLDPDALLRGDRRRLREVVDLGCAAADHAAFVARLDEARRRIPPTQ